MSNNRVEVHVGAKTSELKKGMNDAESIVHNTARDIEAIGKKIDFDIDVSKVQKSFDTLSNNISSQILSLGKKIAVGLGSAIAIDGLIDLSKNVVNTASEVNKLSQLVGESVEDFQYFAAGAKTAGLSLDQFGQMGKDALDRLGEARRGEGEMMDFFEKIAPKIGITIDQFKNLSGPDVIQAYYSGLEKANLSHAETITYMEQIVNDGSLLIPLLKDGGAGFKKWGEEAKKAGAIMSKDMVDNLGKVKDNVYMLQLHFQGFQAMLINIVTPVVSAIAQNFDNIKAVVIALGAAISAKLVVQCAVLAKEFVIGIAQGIAYQMQLSALQGQALRTASALGILRNASVLLGGAGGLAMLALQGVAAGAAFLYMKRTSDEVTPSLSIQSKSIAELREEYEKLDKVQQRVLTRKATENLDKASKTYKRQEIALLGAVRALIKHSDASDADKKSVKELYDLYLSGERTVEQLASAINNLRTVEEKHKTGIDEKAASVIKERKAILDAESVLNTYNNTVRQGTKDNREHTNSINDKANALANLTAKQIEYVSESQKQAERERYIQHNMNVNGLSRARAEHMADVRASAGMGYTANTGAMPEAVRQAEAADWKRKQAEAMRQETERKAEKSKYEETKYSDLRIKSTEAYAGGKSHQAILDLAGMIQEKFQIIRFTAFNDKYHQGTNSKHAQGLALDFTLQDAKKSPIISSEIKNLLGKNGINGQVIDEYKSPSARATGGHIHVSFNSQADANKYLGLVKNNEIKAKSSKQTSSDNQYEQFLQKEIEKAEEAEKQKIALQYKYADEQKQIAIDLQNALDVIKKSKLSEEEKQLFSIKAEKDAADKIKEIRIEQLIKIKTLQEEELRGKELIAQRIYELEMAQLQALVNAGKFQIFKRFTWQNSLKINFMRLNEKD